MELQWTTEMRTAKANTKDAAMLDESMRLRLSKADKRAFLAAAKRQNRSLSNWLRFVARQAAGLGQT